MSATAPPDVLKLIERFERNVESYRNSSYNEAQVRKEFIDPLFEALGWDMANKAGNAEAYKDVIHEDAIKVGGTTKAPDYCFRVGPVRKFFLEAKKPAVNIKDDSDPAYQLRRYAWSAKLPLSILTDFEEFAVYDCRTRPNPADKPSTGRTLYLTYKDYAEKWNVIASTFSKDAVFKGSFDKYAVSERKRGTTTVDAEFLAEIEQWRDSLARNLALRNQALSVHDLNFSVQRTIDRLIFLRICEDRGIEPDAQLMGLLNGEDVYGRLRQIFDRADDRYNSGLFHFHSEKDRAEAPDTLTPALKVDDKVLKDIIRRLYYPESPYEFSVLPAEILGQVYEQFLGKVIRLTSGHQAKVEEKPEVKKARGVYYTPAYIVEYIVRHAVGTLCEDKTPKQITKLRILDPACGSGSFLIGAYAFLLARHLDWYVKDGPAKHTKEIYKGIGSEWRLTTQEKKRILLNNIYGVDIDSQAVEVTKLSLLLKVLEGESQETLTSQMRLWHQRALPDLGDNIKCGNSLIGPDFFSGQLLPDEDAMRRINPFDWQAEFPDITKAGGFDAVIGNPPYGMVTDENLKEYAGDSFETTEGRFDTYELFIEKGIKLCRPLGFLGYIVPSPLLSNLYARKLRSHIIENCSIQEITNFGMDVFSDPTIHTFIIVLTRGQNPKQIVQVRKQVTAINQLETPYDYKISQSNLGKNEHGTFDIFIDPIASNLVGKLTAKARPLGETFFIRQCIKTGDDAQYVRSSKTPPGGTWKKTLRGRSIVRYGTHEKDLYLNYGSWLARNWQNKSFYETPKIAIREAGNRLIATLDLENRYFLSSLYAIYPKSNSEPLSLQFPLGLLNSQLATYYVKVIALDLTKGAFTKIRTNQLARLPIRSINFSNPSDKAKHDKMVVLVERMLDLHTRLAASKNPDDKTRLQRQVDATDREIDQLVYDLYGLTEEEIQIVEGKSA